MGMFDSYRQRRAALSTRESMDTLLHMEEFFQEGGANWTQGVYRGEDGARCLVGAAEHVRVSTIDDAKHWLRQAITEQTAGAITTIEGYNDSRQSFGEIEAVISRAKQLAATAQLPAPEIIAPVRLALPSSDRPDPVVIDVAPQVNDLSRRSVAKTEPVRARRPSLFDWND